MSHRDERPREDDDSLAGTPRREGEQKVDWDDPSTWPEEIGGSKGPEPTRYGDWERNGRCSDF